MYPQGTPFQISKYATALDATLVSSMGHIYIYAIYLYVLRETNKYQNAWQCFGVMAAPRVC